MTELIRLLGYALFAAGILVPLYEFLLFLYRKEEGDNP